MKKTPLAIMLVSALSVQAFDPREAISVSSDYTKSYNQIFGVVPTTNYDDTVDGDYGDRLNPTAVSLMTEADRFIGNVGGSDFDDCFIFTIENDIEINSIVLESYTTSNGNESSGFNLYTGTPPDGGAFGDLVTVAVTQADVGTNLMGVAEPLVAGTYTICMLEGLEDQGFQLVLLSNFPGDVIFKNGFESLP